MSKKVVLYYSSATSSLSVKKDTQSLKFLLEKKKAHYEEVDLAQMQKEERDKIYHSANSNTIPLLFVDGNYVGDYETLQNLEEEEKLAGILGVH